MPEILKELEINMLKKENSLFNEPISLELFHLASMVGGVQTLKARDYKDPQCVVLENHPADSRITISKNNIVQTLSSRMGTGGGNTPMIMESSVKQAEQEQYENLVVRRLTPTECGRLQGYPDGWMDIGEWKDSKGKVHKESDAPKYKAAGNSIALPFWQWLMDKIGKQLRKDGNENPTMASLFDGISGFPLCAARVGIEPVWSSEIEEFPIAVAEKHFGENGDYKKYL